MCWRDKYMQISTSQKLSLLSAIFVASLIAANLLGVKITTLLGISVSVGIFAYPITFLITDSIEEVFGKKPATHLMYSALIAQILVFIIIVIAIKLPSSERYEFNDEYVIIFSSSLRIIIASIIAFFLSQTHDIWAFNFWKKQTNGKFLWLRNNLSTIASQFLDTTIFMFIAFYNISPKFDSAFIFSLIIPYWLFKVAFALIDTPLVYALVWWLKKDKHD
ncbi:MAG: transporter [Parcubacteria group bacterium CG11_big_fil_rev_8_21_14_0_20_41_14]|nr:MAG: transporter [Parcubacteria group bacterium CG11_big_fil_rev_8_21_14_0_20_41_14]PIR56699.1 MAG: transporter [Parcubacteria group bacterium CG10_big_fil_rev_8_21_14_0_10_41_35]